MSTTAVATTLNGKQVLEVTDEGVMCEVLGWKMDVENPGAANIISAALNKCTDFAMRTTAWRTNIPERWNGDNPISSGCFSSTLVDGISHLSTFISSLVDENYLISGRWDISSL